MKRGRFTTSATTFAAVLSLLSVSLPSQAGTAGAEVLALASNCALPVVHDIYDGFHIGVPAGWDLSTLGGDITVSPNLAGPEGDIVYPALLTKGVTAGSVLTGFMGYVQGLVRKSGGVFNYQMRTAANGLPVASVNEKVSGALLSGATTVSVLTLKTQMASNEAVVSFYYAPRDGLRADATTLSRIASCYGPEHATLFELFNQQPQAPFAFVEPPGWHIGTEGQDDFELENSGDTASATYDFWGPLVQGVNVSQPLSTPAEAISYWFGKLGFKCSDAVDREQRHGAVHGVHDNPQRQGSPWPHLHEHKLGERVDSRGVPLGVGQQPAMGLTQRRAYRNGRLDPARFQPRSRRDPKRQS